MASLIPSGTTWIAQSVERFDPDNNTVVLDNQDAIRYAQLVGIKFCVNMTG
jgi:methionine synthase II (cobalamin-independent)